MIPRAFVTEWQSRVPWPELYQVEQDLILSRLMIEIASNDLLKKELVMRGGTCLHKLHLSEPVRYSEDLDYVRRTESQIGPYFDELREIAARVGLEVSHVKLGQDIAHMTLDAEQAIGPGRIRIKVETNIAEVGFFQKPITIDHVIESLWWSGQAPISTFVLDEMMATKLRALYQRSKGRDLLDLWLVVTTEDVDCEQIVAGLHHYMKDKVFTYPQLRQNLLAKVGDADFRSDLETLVTAMPDRYDVDAAADVVMDRLGSLLRNAAPLEDVRGGRWREKR